MTETRIIIAGQVDLAPERIGEALEAAQPLIEGALTEPGCLEYDWCADARQPGRLRVFERWSDEASLAAHFRGEWYQRMRETLAEFGILGAETAKYRVDLAEPVYDETMTARADFFTDPARAADR